MFSFWKISGKLICNAIHYFWDKGICNVIFFESNVQSPGFYLSVLPLLPLESVLPGPPGRALGKGREIVEGYTGTKLFIINLLVIRQVPEDPGCRARPSVRTDLGKKDNGSLIDSLINYSGKVIFYQALPSCRGLRRCLPPPVFIWGEIMIQYFFNYKIALEIPSAQVGLQARRARRPRGRPWPPWNRCCHGCLFAQSSEHFYNFIF